MRRYDTTFIVNSQIGDDGIDASVKEIANLITSDSGSILREQRIGSRRLAYEISRQTHGYYVSIIHECETGTLNKLDRHFDLGGNYLRHLTIRFDGDPFRKTITEVMMGFESEKRGSGDKSGDDSRPAPRVAKAGSSTPAAASPAPKAVPKTAPKTDPKIESPAPAAEVKTAAPAESTAQSTTESKTESTVEPTQSAPEDESTL